MKVWLKWGSVAAVILLSGCATSDADETAAAAPTTPTAATSESVGTPRAKVDLGTVQYALAEFGHHFKNLAAMAQVDVLLGRVTAERKGLVAPGDEGEGAEQRRIITVTVDEKLAGPGTPGEFDLRTPGWITRSGKQVPLSYENWAWLQVGDEVMLAVADPSGKGDYGFASDAGVQVFRDGRIAQVPGEPSALNRELQGMTKDDVRQAFAKLSD